VGETYHSKIDLSKNEKEVFYQNIVSASSEGRLVLFVGAGFSRLFGLPSWNSLAKDVFEKESGIKPGDIQLIEESTSDKKMLLTLAFNQLAKHKKEKLFARILHRYLKVEPNSTTKKYYSVIRPLVARCSYVVTTNADLVLEKAGFSSKCVYWDVKEISKWPKVDAQQKALIHLHGRVTDGDSLVFTVPSYLDRYGKNKEYADFLTTIFASNVVVLFIGYGLEEYELMNFLVSRKDPKALPYYALVPFYSYQKPVQQAMKEFYKTSYGIEQIPFCIDKKGYKQLIDELAVINSRFSKERLLVPNFIKCQRLMEKEPTPGAVVSFLSDFSKLNQDQKSTLEKKMANVPNSFAWVETLQKNGDCDWFDAPKNIQPGIHESGGVRGKLWTGLELLAMLFRKDPNCAWLRSTLYTALKNALDFLNTHPEYCDNFVVIQQIGDLLFSDPVFIDGGLALRYIQLTLSVPDRYRYLYYSLFDRPDGFLKSKKEAAFQISSIVLESQVFLDETDTLHLFLKNDFLPISMADLETAANLLRGAINKVLQIDPYAFYAIGSIHDFSLSFEYGRQGTAAVLVDAFRTMLVKMRDSGLAVNLCLSLLGSSEDIEKKFGIYLAGITSAVLPSMLKNILSLINQRSLFPDFYYFFSDGAPHYSDQKDKMIVAINNANFGLANHDTILGCRYLCFKQLASFFPEAAALAKTSFKEEYQQIDIDALGGYFVEKTFSPSESLYDQVKGLDYAKALSFFNHKKLSIVTNESDYFSAFRAYFQSNDSFQKLKDDFPKDLIDRSYYPVIAQMIDDDPTKLSNCSSILWLLAERMKGSKELSYDGSLSLLRALLGSPLSSEDPVRCFALVKDILEGLPAPSFNEDAFCENAHTYFFFNPFDDGLALLCSCVLNNRSLEPSLWKYLSQIVSKPILKYYAISGFLMRAPSFIKVNENKARDNIKLFFEEKIAGISYGYFAYLYHPDFLLENIRFCLLNPSFYSFLTFNRYTPDDQKMVENYYGWIIYLYIMEGNERAEKFISDQKDRITLENIVDALHFPRSVHLSGTQVSQANFLFKILRQRKRDDNASEFDLSLILGKIEQYPGIEYAWDFCIHLSKTKNVFAISAIFDKLTALYPLQKAKIMKIVGNIVETDTDLRFYHQDDAASFCSLAYKFAKESQYKAVWLKYANLLSSRDPRIQKLACDIPNW